MTEPDAGGFARDIEDLQRRVRYLEERLGRAPAVPAREPEAEPNLRLPPYALPTIGRALLAIAGAYVLRALTELGVISHVAGVTAGLAYAVAWLFVAARLPAKTRFPVAVSAATSVAIMGPLLWEAATRLNAISSWTGAAVLTGYVCIGLALSWRERRTVVATIASASSTLVAAVLLVATHDLFPFTMALLVIAAAMEFQACRGRPSASRWLTAATANFAVVVLSWIVSRAGGLPEGYAAIPAHAAWSAQFLLLGIYVASAATRTLIQRHSFTLLETGQTATALFIGIGGAAWMASGNARAALALGLFALIAGLACYVVAFVVAGLEILWNFRAWATFGMLLVLAGTFLLSGSGYWLLWCGCAVACCGIAMAAHRPTLGLHGAVYLLLGALASGAAGQPLWQFFGLDGAGPRWPVAVLVVASALLAWAAVLKSPPGDTARWRKQVSSFTLAAIVTWLAAGAANYALIRIWPGGSVPADTLGTVVLTLLSVALAWSRIRWDMKELVWLVYGFMGLSAWKLVARDFQHEHNLMLVVSLLFYGGTLILLPRILQRGRP